MTRAMAHRGPDGEGVWASTADERGHGCLLGHRRLAILDLSAAADQPMTDVVGAHPRTVVFNGEIYNFQALRRQLEGRGEHVASTGDTAVMLRLLGLDGPDAVAQLRGMFALGLWDDRDRTLTLARDPLGIKPLYVCANPDTSGSWTYLFASELRALLASQLLPTPKLSPRALESVLWNGFVAGTQTAVAGVELLAPGEVRVVDARGTTMRSRRFWQFSSPSATRPHASEGEMEAALKESVKLHMLSDVPLGIFLSGGIDSSAVANLAQRANGAPVHTFTLAFEEEQFDEGRFSRAIAKAIGTEHREILLTEQQFANALETAIDTIDQPTFDGLNSYFVSKAVRDAGLTVALVGTGGDELFAGYPTFGSLPSLRRWSRRTRMVPAGVKQAGAALVARALAGSSRGPVPPQTRWAKLPDMVRTGDDLLASYQYAYGLFLPDFQRQLMLAPPDDDGAAFGLGRAFADGLRLEAAGRSAVAQVSILEQRLFLGERLLRDTDAASMAVSLETRLPLVDSVVSETADRMVDSARFLPLGKKSVLRRMGLQGLDPALFDRPKRGFVLPFDRWIRRSLGTAMDSTMRDAALVRSVGLNPTAVANLWTAFQAGAPGLYWSRVWVLYVLIRWCHRHGVFA
jgi:asparagine synthase (glutamine-hydrolysing)